MVLRSRTGRVGEAILAREAMRPGSDHAARAIDLLACAITRRLRSGREWERFGLMGEDALRAPVLYCWHAQATRAHGAGRPGSRLMFTQPTGCRQREARLCCESTCGAMLAGARDLRSRGK
jgi:hypothetical protein